MTWVSLVKLWDTGKSNGVSLERVAQRRGWPQIPGVPGAYLDTDHGTVYVDVAETITAIGSAFYDV